MEYEFKFSGSTHKVKIDFEGGVYKVDVGESTINVDSRPISENCLSLIINDRSHKVFIAINEKKRHLHIDGHHFCLEEVEETPRAGYARGSGIASGEQSVSAPMPGTIVKVQVSEGDEVEKNQSLVIVESMKMENALRSPTDGRVKKIHYTDGDLVDAGVPIVEIVPQGETG